MAMICTRCGTVGTPETGTGLIDSIRRLISRQEVCSACGAATLVPTSSPVGRQLAAQHHANVDVEAIPKGNALRGIVWIAIAVAIIGWIVYASVSSR
jgi:hypothetical protein